MGMWVILIGDKNFTPNLITSINFGNKRVMTKKYEERQFDVIYENGYIQFLFDYDGTIKADYTPEELSNLPFTDPNMILMQYSDRALLTEALRVINVSENILIDCDGVNLGLEQIVGKSKLINAHGTLDTGRLISIPLLRQSGWQISNCISLPQRYADITNKKFIPQVPLRDIFLAAEEIIESLEGICVKNLHPELGLGKNSYTIEFSFFEYDSSLFPDLQAMNAQVREKLLFIGIGYDIIGDWLVAESGKIYFRNKQSGNLHLMSNGIYEFLEGDIYNLRDKNDIYIL